jgi:hypothetical protein
MLCVLEMMPHRNPLQISPNSLKFKEKKGYESIGHVFSPRGHVCIFLKVLLVHFYIWGGVCRLPKCNESC